MVRKVPRCNVQLSEKKEEIERDEKEGSVSKVTFEKKSQKNLVNKLKKRMWKK